MLYVLIGVNSFFLLNTLYVLWCAHRGQRKFLVLSVFIPLWLPWIKFGFPSLGGRHECFFPSEPRLNSISDLGQLVYMSSELSSLPHAD